MKRPAIATTLALALALSFPALASAGQARARGGSGQQPSAARPAPSGGSSQRVAVPRSGSGQSSAPARVTSQRRNDGGSNNDQVSSTRRSGGSVRSSSGDPGRQAVVRAGRSRDGRIVTGQAVPRGPGYYPVRPAYVYRGSYWNRYYWYPYGFGAWGVGWYPYDPFYYGGWGPSPYYYGGGSGYGYAYGDYDTGQVRLKLKPRDAQVFVDGGYAGVVDEFDGAFQRLRLETGTHKIEVRKEGFEPLVYDVHVSPDRTLTLRGELQPDVR